MTARSLGERKKERERQTETDRQTDRQNTKKHRPLWNYIWLVDFFAAAVAIDAHGALRVFCCFARSKKQEAKKLICGSN